MIKSDLLPKGSKLDSLDRNGMGTREYHYEYKEEKLPGGKYDRKDFHTVEVSFNFLINTKMRVVYTSFVYKLIRD